MNKVDHPTLSFMQTVTMIIDVSVEAHLGNCKVPLVEGGIYYFHMEGDETKEVPEGKWEVRETGLLQPGTPMRQLVKIYDFLRTFALIFFWRDDEEGTPVYCAAVLVPATE